MSSLEKIKEKDLHRFNQNVEFLTYSIAQEPQMIILHKTVLFGLIFFSRLLLLPYNTELNEQFLPCLTSMLQSYLLEYTNYVLLTISM